MDVGYLVSRVEDRSQTINPKKIALKLEVDRTWTYEELNSVTNQYANSLRKMGVNKGDCVGILLYNCLEYFALYFAAAKLGAIAVRINFRLSSEELKYILQDSGTKILVMHSDLAEKTELIRESIGVETYICFERNKQPVPEWAIDSKRLYEGEKILISEEVSPGDPVMLMYTSGTTGKPKGALWSHQNTLWFSSMQALKWGFNSETIGMTTGPLYHVGAMEDLSLSVLLMGGTVIITHSGGFKIEKALSIIESEKVTECFLFPFMVYEMLQVSNLADYQIRLDRIFSGGDPVVPWAIEKLNEFFPDIGFVQVYGLTEGTPIATALDPNDARRKGHTVGKAMPFTKIKIVGQDGETLESGEVGEICIKGPAVSLGYWDKPEATEETFIKGWCHTGDLGFIDSEGYLAISGRKKDMIRSGGENIYAIEVEDVIMRHPSVRRAAIIGIPDPKFIEAVCAVVVLKEGEQLTEQEVIAFTDGKIANYKKPRKVVFVEELPMTPSGKIQKFRLRETFKKTQI